MTRFLSSAEELLENETASSEKISKLKQQIESKKHDLVAKNLEKEAILPVKDLEAEIGENTQTLEEIDNIVFDLQKSLYYKIHKFQGPFHPHNQTRVYQK